MPSNPAQPPYRIDDTLPPIWRQTELQRLAVEASTEPEIRSLGTTFRDEQAALHDGVVDPHALAQRILSWTQDNFPYHDDPPGEEWYQGVYWTMAMGGDCEDLAVVLVALMLAADIQARVIWQDQPGQALNHVTAQVLMPDGIHTWYWADPTVKGARLGEEPHEAAKRLGQLDKLGLAPAPEPRI